MLILTMTGLLVGVVVSERQRAERAAREIEARLKALQAEAARAARMNMVSGMASALAHEINQPMTAARALARSAQELLRQPEADTQRARTIIWPPWWRRSIMPAASCAACASSCAAASRTSAPSTSARCWRRPWRSPGPKPRPTAPISI